MMKYLVFVVVIFFTACSGSETFKETSNKVDVQVDKTTSQDENSLVEKNVLRGMIGILLPSQFDLMAKDILEAKYPASNRPTEVYSNKKGTVSIAFNHTTNNISLQQLSYLLPVFDNQFSNLYPSIIWYRKEIIKVNDQDFIILEFETPAMDTQIYNLMAVSSLDGRMIIGSFNCPVGMKSEWKVKGNQIINSIRILK